MKKVDFAIMGKDWELRLPTKATFRRLHGTGASAITDTDLRKIDLTPDGVLLETIIHELVHAYLAEICTHSADLDSDASEEIFADLMSKRGKELLYLADKLFLDAQALVKKGKK